jgi:hypothetical protein
MQIPSQANSAHHALDPRKKSNVRYSAFTTATAAEKSYRRGGSDKGTQSNEDHLTSPSSDATPALQMIEEVVKPQDDDTPRFCILNPQPAKSLHDIIQDFTINAIQPKSHSNRNK